MSLDDGFQRGRTDDEIAQEVLEKLRAYEDMADPHFLEISVEEGVLRLSGFTRSYAAKLAIERAVSSVVGVREMRDYLEVVPPNECKPDDRQIETAARRTLEWDARLSQGVQARVTDGVVRLHGAVNRFSQRNAAEQAVRNLIGVRDVLNEIKLAPAPVPSSADLELEVDAAIRRRFGPECRGIWIAAADGVVTLTGVVPTVAMLDDIQDTVRSIPGVRRVIDRLLVA
jgi:osmotically-inducible protein OsmY